MKFKIKDGPRCPGVVKIVKRLLAGEVPPPMPPKPPKPVDLRFIDSLSYIDCKIGYERVQARLIQRLTKDSMVYGIQRTYKGGRRYHTCVPGMGAHQCLATDMGHRSLWLTLRRASAELVLDCFKHNDLWHADWEVFEIPKTVAVTLPCYTSGPNYATRPAMVGVVK